MNGFSLSRRSFFWLLWLMLTLPLLTHKLIWLARSIKTTGIVGFQGRSYTGQIGHTYSVVSFYAGGRRVWFNTFDNMLYAEGTRLPLRYLPNHPESARLTNFTSLWGDTLVYGGIPLLILVIVFLHPQIIPRRSRVSIAFQKPWIRIH